MIGSVVEKIETYGYAFVFDAFKRRLRSKGHALKSRFVPGPPEPLPFSFTIDPPAYVHGASAPPAAPNTINWVIPPLYSGSGGHRTIFRLARDIEAAGFNVEFYVFGDSIYRSDAEITAAMRAFYFPMRASVHLGLAEMRPCHSVFATSWETAYAVRAFGAAQRKLYLVQDDEALFYPAGSARSLVEQTYRFGFDCVCAGPWLEERMRELGRRAMSFRLAYDHSVYKPAQRPRSPAAKPRVVFYARFATARRGVELGFLALALLKRRRPDVEILYFGQGKAPFEPPFPCEWRGKMSEPELAELYGDATVGLSVSLSNYSLIPQEMLACGLPVVETDHRSLRLAYPNPGSALELAAPEPEALAAALERQLDAALRDPIGQRAAAAALVGGTSWEAASEAVLAELRAP